MINKAIVVGRLGKDPEQKSETAPVRFSVATDEKYKNKAGEMVEDTQWHSIEAWGKLGEICLNYLRKGKLVYIEGSMQSREHEGKYYHSIKAREMKMLEKRSESDSSGEPF